MESEAGAIKAAPMLNGMYPIFAANEKSDLAAMRRRAARCRQPSARPGGVLYGAYMLHPKWTVAKRLHIG